MKDNEDIFDRLMRLPVLRVFEPFYKKHKEILLYMLFGALTTLVSVGSFALFIWLGMNELVANVISWILSVAFAYITNRTWVFDNKADTADGVVREAASFVGGRLATLLMEEAILAVFITWLGFPALPVKIAATILVIAVNYVISKFLVFRGKGHDKES